MPAILWIETDTMHVCANEAPRPIDTISSTNMNISNCGLVRISIDYLCHYEERSDVQSPGAI